MGIHQKATQPIIDQSNQDNQKRQWSIWKKYLGFMVMSQTTLVLRQPLGKWKEESPRTLWQYHELSDRLSFQHSQGPIEYHRIRGTSRRIINRGCIPASKIDESPSDTVDTMIWEKATTTYMSGTLRVRPVSSINPAWYFQTVS
jgi:hypothetical protein